MSTALTRTVTVLATILVLAAVNFSIHAKEQLIRHGELLYLELAPVDPRSLMQGDYMALRFTLAAQIETASPPRSVTAVPMMSVVLDDRRIATLAASGTAGSLKIRYRIRNGRVWLGTNAYFFEEGTAARFTGARYGEFKVDRASGEAVLVGLRDAEFRAL
jgi:uncharacterized membrane-anchored protein